MMATWGMPQGEKGFSIVSTEALEAQFHSQIVCCLADEHNAAEGDVGDALEEKGFSIVSTEALEAQGLTPHPNPIAETATLASILPPSRPYKVALPTDVLIRESAPECGPFQDTSCPSRQHFIAGAAVQSLAANGCSHVLGEAMARANK